MTINEKRRKAQLEVIKSFKDNNYNGFALVPTGTGKAWILIEILKTLKPKTCWYLCDSEDNRDITFKNELIKWKAEEYIDKIEFICYQSAHKLKNFNVDLLLADEADFSLTKVYSKVYSQNKFKHKVLVSGTLDSKKYDLLENLNISVIHNLDINAVEKEGILNKANYYIVNYLLNKYENAKYLNFNKAFAKVLNRHHTKKEIENLQINRKHFLSALDSSANVCRRLMKHLYDKDKNNKILIFSGLSEQANKVCKFSYHSKTDDKHFKLFDEGLIPALAVVSKADRGLNIKNVNNIIHEAPTRSSTKFLQRTGRGRRLAVNEILSVFFLVPYYKDRFGKIKPTTVYNWVFDAAKKIENFNPKTYKF